MDPRGPPCGRAVHDGDALAHARNGREAQEQPSETRVNARYAIGIVPYWLDHGLRAPADVVYTPENGRDSEEHEPYDPDYDVRTLDNVVSRVCNVSGEPACRRFSLDVAQTCASARQRGLTFAQATPCAARPPDSDCLAT